MPLARSATANVSPRTTAGSWKATFTGTVCFAFTFPRAVILFEFGERATQKEDLSFWLVLDVVLFFIESQGIAGVYFPRLAFPPRIGDGKKWNTFTW